MCDYDGPDDDYDSWDTGWPYETVETEEGITMELNTVTGNAHGDDGNDYTYDSLNDCFYAVDDDDDDD